MTNSPQADPSIENARLLCVYDLCSQPVSLGDFFMFQYGAYIISKLANIPKIDFNIFYDKHIPHLDMHFHNVLELDNHLNRVMKLLPILEINPAIDSISILGSHLQFSEALARMNDNVALWPSTTELHDREYLYYKIIKLIDKYWRQYGALPRIKLRTPQRKWVTDIYENKAKGRIPVTVNIRNNPSIHSYRNSNIEAWLQFFQYCLEKNYPVTFIVVCERAEIDPRMRNYSNVIIAKDYDSTIDLDLSLIMSSAFHIGTASGPGAIAQMSGNPFFISNMDCVPNLKYYDGVMRYDEKSGYLSLSFCDENQKHSVEKESFEVLVREFTSLWNCRAWSLWKFNN